MSLFSNIFKKKEGGTLFGNLLRVGSNKLTGGILGTGAGIIPVGTAAAQKAADDAAKLGQDNTALLAQVAALKSSAAVLGQQTIASTAYGAGGAIQSLTASQTAGGIVDNAAAGAFVTWFKTNWWMILFPLGALGYFIFKKK